MMTCEAQLPNDFDHEISRQKEHPKMYGTCRSVLLACRKLFFLVLHESLLFLTDTMTVHLMCEKMIVGEVTTDMDLVGGDLILARTGLIVKRRQ